MLVVSIRALILYLVVLVTVRIMGKRELGQLQPFEFVIAIMMADLAATPMADTGCSHFSWHCAYFCAAAHLPDHILADAQE